MRGANQEKQVGFVTLTTIVLRQTTLPGDVELLTTVWLAGALLGASLSRCLGLETCPRAGRRFLYGVRCVVADNWWTVGYHAADGGKGEGLREILHWSGTT
jgi:hypothetical protein